MTTRPLNFILSLVLLLFVGCYPGGARYVDQLDLVYTDYNPDFDFGTVTTFTIPDSIPLVEEDSRPGDDEIEFVQEPYRSTIISELRAALEDRGFQYVDYTADPDMIFFPTASTDTETYYYYWGGYWGWWGGWGGWGWWYPGYYPGYGYATNYEIGTVMIQCVYDDPKLPEDADKPVQWIGMMNGLLQGSESSVDSRVESSIQQMFAQSEYLRR